MVLSSQHQSLTIDGPKESHIITFTVKWVLEDLQSLKFKIMLSLLQSILDQYSNVVSPLEHHSFSRVK